MGVAGYQSTGKFVGFSRWDLPVNQLDQVTYRASCIEPKGFFFGDHTPHLYVFKLCRLSFCIILNGPVVLIDLVASIVYTKEITSGPRKHILFNPQA
jgi:hypothetical protein